MTLRTSSVTVAALLVGISVANSPAHAEESEAYRLGLQLYRHGLLADGQPSTAIVQGDVEASGIQFTCTGCHQRSGLGTSEGGQQTPAVTGSILFAPIEIRRRELEPKVIRQAYDIASLKAAIRSGVGPSGEILDPLMPRYPLSDLDLDNLITYLSSLTQAADPGVTADTIHFATVIAGPVPAGAADAVQNVIDRYVHDKNSLTRQEDRRAENAPWHKDLHYESYRTWQLHTWKISGDPSTWVDQLEAAYKEQPVFAVIGGMGSGDWAPVDSFCNAMRLPCILPSTLLAPTENPDFYTLYYNAGMGLEAKVLARYLTAEDNQFASCKVLQIHDASPHSSQAAIQFGESFSAAGGHTETLTVGAESTFADIDWSRALTETKACAVVLWLPSSTLDNLDVLQGFSQLRNIYLSASLTPEPVAGFSASVQEKIRMIYPYQLAPYKRQNPRLTGWARGKQIELTHKRLQANAFYAFNLTADAMQHIRGYYSRDYFLEKIEHMANRMLAVPAYGGLSLAPGQRFLSKGAYIVSLPEEPGDEMIPVSDWIVP